MHHSHNLAHCLGDYSMLKLSGVYIYNPQYAKCKYNASYLHKLCV